jgi:multimeric flavodoxin WrbA
MTHALALNCSLKPSPDPSSTAALIADLLAEFSANEVTGEQIRVVDFDVRPGVLADMGDGDEWPALRERLLAADILVLGTPTWMGHMSSVAQRVLERLDAELSETDAEGRLSMSGKLAVAVVVGNEDGAHKITADLYQALADVGFTIPAQGGTYWNGEAMQTKDYNDLGFVPETVRTTNRTLARNAAHLSRLLQASPYPVK